VTSCYHTVITINKTLKILCNHYFKLYYVRSYKKYVTVSSFLLTVRLCKEFHLEDTILLSTPLSLSPSLLQGRQPRGPGISGSIYKQEQDTSAAFKSTDKRQGNMQLFLAIVAALSACQLAVGIEDEDAISGEVINFSNLFQTRMLHFLITKKKKSY